MKEPKERGVKLTGEVLTMVLEEMERDHRPSLANAVATLIREAVATRKDNRLDERTGH